jgi:hypothetical protein
MAGKTVNSLPQVYTRPEKREKQILPFVQDDNPA